MIRRAETGNVVRNLQQSLDETIGHPRRNTPDTPDLITHPPAACSLSLSLSFLLPLFLSLSLSLFVVASKCHGQRGPADRTEIAGCGRECVGHNISSTARGALPFPSLPVFPSPAKGERRPYESPTCRIVEGEFRE